MTNPGVPEKRRAWRRLVGVSLITAGIVGSPLVVAHAGAAGSVVAGGMTDTNACDVSSMAPSGSLPSSTGVPESVQMAADASPEPHDMGPTTLSNAMVTFTIAASQLQAGVSAGLLHDGVVIPTVLEPVVAGSKTAEATHAYSVNAAATVHVVAGVAQPLVATAKLPDTSWTPVDPNAAVVFSEQSLKVVQTIALGALGQVTTTSACTPSTPATIATLDGLPETVTGTTTDTNSCASTVDPAVAPPSTTTTAVTVAASASPNPPNGKVFTLSRGKLTFTAAAGFAQLAVNAGVLRDGDLVPVTANLVLAASNTSESTHTYTLSAPIHVHVINGVAQPLATTVSLPDALWHPVNGAAPVVVMEQSLRAVLSFTVAGLQVTDTLACTPSGTTPIVTLAGGVPAIVPGAGTVTEGNSGTTNLEVPVTLTFPSSAAVSAHWSTEFLSQGAAVEEAQADVDYSPASGVVTFAPGATTATVTIPVHGDTIPEADEYVVVAFGSPVSATIGGFYGLGFGTITNDDDAVVGPGGASIAEGQTGTSSLEVPVTLSKPATVPVTVQWNTVFIDGASAIQATPGVDYTTASGTVTFQPGETAKTVAISVFGDHDVEPDQWIVVSFHTPTGPARIGGYYGLGFGVIVNDD